MRYAPETKTFRGSATDLANHARCAHLTQRARALAVDVAEGSVERVDKSNLVIEKGRAFEASYVAGRRAEVQARGGRFVDIKDEAGGDPRRGRELLAQAMRDGVELIAQAPLRSGDVFGFADLLELVDGGTYEPVEIKYARSVRPEHVLQACAYADALTQLQGGVEPSRFHVVCGDGTRHSHATSEYIEYYRAARGRFAEALLLDLDAELALVPDPVAHCAGCDFASICNPRREAVDHLSLVARIRTDQRAKLADEGITTLTELATSELERVPGIGRATLEQLKAQAALQLAARTQELPGVEYRLPAEDEPAGRGFALLPEPDAEDMFFDFEGYPFHDSGALEYLWGWTTHGADGEPRFDYLWADDPQAEGVAFSRFLDEVHARRARSAGMHVFHYAPYEITALLRLAKLHPHEMERLDQLLRAGVFVDLFAVVRQAMLVGTPSYSIKKLEPLYGVSREGDELADGGASIDVYEQWVLTGDTGIRDTIIDYNRVDCDSTLELRDWLLGHRELARAAGIEWPIDEPEADEEIADEDSISDEPHPTTVLVERLEQVADDETRPDDVRLVARLLSAMPGWQRRTRREFFGDLHARKRDREVEDFIDEPTALAGLELIETAPIGKGSTLRTYRYPEQVTLIKDGQDALDATTVQTLGKIELVDLDARTVSIRTGPKPQARLDAERAPLPRAIVGWDPIPLKPLETAAAAVAEQLLAALDAGRDPFVGSEPCAAALSMLARHDTRPLDGSGPEAIVAPPDPAAIAELVERCPGSHVIVQGPPGTGKTYTSARLIIELVEAGLRVGISSNSHDAVINVLEGINRYRVERVKAGRPVAARAAYPLRSKEKAPGTFGFGEDWIERSRSSDDACAALADGDVQILAGTAWLFAKGTPVDVVLADEAGQVSLLHATAMACAARTVVLVGDPQQLPQPASTMHPHGCGASVLEHLFGEHAVLPPERAVLLPQTRRMHPDIASYISETYYERRLTAHPDTREQYVDAPGLPRTGLVLVEAEHYGNRVCADEEVEAIAAIVRGLLASGRVVPKPGELERAVEPRDIIVVAPYNAQRRALQAALGDEIAVGTVDKFQGQEAPISILSMTASSKDELPRGLEFLLDPHRLNVALSRARSLAIMVASPALLATTAGSLREMRLLNDLARFARAATPLRTRAQDVTPL